MYMYEKHGIHKSRANYYDRKWQVSLGKRVMKN